MKTKNFNPRHAISRHLELLVNLRIAIRCFLLSNAYLGVIEPTAPIALVYPICDGRLQAAIPCTSVRATAISITHRVAPRAVDCGKQVRCFAPSGRKIHLRLYTRPLHAAA
jgi:hypothetical protein